MQIELIFPSSIVKFSYPKFIDSTKDIIKDNIGEIKHNDWHICQSKQINDYRMDKLLNLIAENSYNMLVEQGYDMSNMQTNVTQAWAQIFLKYGQHIEHVHSFGAQVSGFYFVEVPKINSAYPIFFDPRPAKKQIDMPELDSTKITYASKQIIMEIKPGDLILTNAWLPHGFTRHESDSPMMFIHFNVNVENMHVCSNKEVEII